MGQVSKPRCGCAGKPGTTMPWYMLQPSFRLKSWPSSRPASEASGPCLAFARGYASSWCTQKRNGSIVSHGDPRGLTFTSALARMHGPALAAGAQLLACVELLEEWREVAHDALQLHLDTVQQRVALQAVPLEAVLHALGTRALDDEAQAPRLGALRRVAHVRWHEEDRAFLQIDLARLAVLHDVEKSVSLHLVEELLVRIVVEVGAVVRAADHGDDEIGVLPDLRITDRRLEQVPVLFDPLREIEGFHRGLDSTPTGLVPDGARGIRV